VNYFQRPETSSTDVRNLLKSPAHYQAGRRENHEPTASMLAGTKFHEYFLLDKDFLVEPDVRRTSSEYKEWLKAAGSPAKEQLISTAELGEFQLMKANILNACKLFEDGLPETELVIPACDLWPLGRKAKLDFSRTDCIVDLKTTTDASPEKFKWSILNYGYDIQLAWYQQCYAAIHGVTLDCYIVAVEIGSPHGVSIFKLSDKTLAAAYEKIDLASYVLKHCLASNVWPGYSTEVNEI
jgi:hypothetical protein